MHSNQLISQAQNVDGSQSVADMIFAYELGIDELRRAVTGITLEQARLRPIAGKWSTLEVVCHLADSE